MKIGQLIPVRNGAHEELHGEIKTLQMHMKVRFIPDYKKTAENAPDYIICANNDIPVGGAWTKRKSQIGDVDLEFLSITIDDPSMPQPLNVAAFKNKNGGWDITWRRRQANSPNQLPPSSTTEN